MTNEINPDLERLFLDDIKQATTAARAASAEAEHLRRSTRKGRIWLVVIWLLAVFLAITLHDEHVRKCMITVEKPHGLCNVIFPFHDHNEIDHLKEHERPEKEKLDGKS